MKNHNTFNHDYHRKLRDIVHNIYKKKYNNFQTFETIHLLLDENVKLKEYYNEMPIFGKNDRESELVTSFYNEMNINYTFLNEYLNFIKSDIKPLFPDETYLVVQKMPNIRFHLPNCTNIGKRESDSYLDTIGVHTDREFGHNTNELNVILPITKMFDTNSIFYEENPDSSQDVHTFNSVLLNENEFGIHQFNKCRHYNKINNTNVTRASFDFRIIPYSKFNSEEIQSATKNIKFDLGDYYMLV